MARDVTSVEFWKSRLEGLTENTLNQSVFRIPKTLFEHMEQHHLTLIHTHIPKNCKVLVAWLPISLQGVIPGLICLLTF